MLCCLFSLSGDWVLLDCVIDRKVRDIFEAILSPSERYQNIHDNPEYNSVLPFRIILKIFAVNMLQYEVILACWNENFKEIASHGDLFIILFFYFFNSNESVRLKDIHFSR